MKPSLKLFVTTAFFGIASGLMSDLSYTDTAIALGFIAGMSGFAGFMHFMHENGYEIG